MTLTERALDAARDARLCRQCTAILVQCYTKAYHKPITSSRFCEDCWVNWKVFTCLLEAEARK